MLTDAHHPWFTRIVTFALSALAAASVVYWGLKGWEASPSLIAPAVAEQAVAFDSQAIARALGGGGVPVAATASALPASSRYGLIGVVAGRLQPGAALISIDGQEARPVRVGNLVDNDMVLESVTGRQAVLASSNGPPLKVTLEMPPLID